MMQRAGSSTVAIRFRATDHRCQSSKPAPPVIVNPPKAPEEAVRRDKKQAPQPRSPEITVPFPDWKPGRGERWDGPCFLKGTEGRGANLPPNAPPDRITCTIQCGKYEVKFFFLGNSGDVCTRPDLLARAQELATRTHKHPPGRGP